MQQKYVDLYDEIKNDDNKVLSLINNSSTSKYFYKPDVGALRYIVDSEGHALYLINKDGLPNEIKDGLVGGDAVNKTYGDYASLTDVYGVTTNLKVYYCSNGINTLYGLEKGDLDNDNPLRVVFPAESEFGNLITGGKGESVTAEDVKSVTELTIDENSKITNLKELYNLTSLRQLILSNVKLENLSGIENCIQLNYLYFQDSKIEDYSSLKGLSKTLTYLYFYNIDNSELVKICDSKKGIGGKDFSKLTYLAFSGTKSRICTTQNRGDGLGDFYDVTLKNMGLTDISPLNNLTDKTCESVNYLSLQNNAIASLTVLKRFENVVLLRVERNNITTLNGLENMRLLEYLWAEDNMLGNQEVSLGDRDADGYDDGVNEDNALVALNNLDKLYLLGLSKNSDLKFTHYISKNSNLKYLFLDSLLNLEGASLRGIKLILNNCEKLILPTKYSLLLLDEKTIQLNLEAQELEKDQFELLKDNTSIRDLNLTNLVLTELGVSSLTDTINNVLKTMTSLQNISLKGIQINSIEFVKNTPNLVRIDLRETPITTAQDDNMGLELLNNCVNLKRFIYDGVADCSLIQSVIGRCNDFSNYTTIFDWGFRLGAFSVTNINTLKSLSNCTGLTSLCLGLNDIVLSENVDLSSLKKLTTFMVKSCGSYQFRIILPDSVTFVEADNGYCPDLKYCTKLNRLVFNSCWQLNSSYDYCHFCSLSENISVYIGWMTFKDNTIKSFDGKNITDLRIGTLGTTYYGDYRCFNIDLPRIKTLEIYSFISSDESIGGIGNFTSLTSLTVKDCGISNITGTEKLTSLSSLDFSKNKINNLNNLKNLKSLTSMNLEFNSIYNTSVVIDDEGQSTTINNLQILADLNPEAEKNGLLTSLYLEGNNAITDFTPIKRYTNWVNKSGF